MATTYPDPDDAISRAEGYRKRVEATIQESRALRQEAVLMRAATRRAIERAAWGLETSRRALADARNPASG